MPSWKGCGREQICCNAWKAQVSGQSAQNRLRYGHLFAAYFETSCPSRPFNASKSINTSQHNNTTSSHRNVGPCSDRLRSTRRSAKPSRSTAFCRGTRPTSRDVLGQSPVALRGDSWTQFGLRLGVMHNNNTFSPYNESFKDRSSYHRFKWFHYDSAMKSVLTWSVRWAMGAEEPVVTGRAKNSEWDLLGDDRTIEVWRTKCDPCTQKASVSDGLEHGFRQDLLLQSGNLAISPLVAKGWLSNALVIVLDPRSLSENRSFWKKILLFVWCLNMASSLWQIEPCPNQGAAEFASHCWLFWFSWGKATGTQHTLCQKEWSNQWLTVFVPNLLRRTHQLFGFKPYSERICFWGWLCLSQVPHRATWKCAAEIVLFFRCFLM